MAVVDGGDNCGGLGPIIWAQAAGFVQIAYLLGDDSELGHFNITYYSKPQTLEREPSNTVYVSYE